MSDERAPAPRPHRPAALAAALVATFAGAAALLALAGVENARAAFDEQRYHFPVVDQFARELPRPDLADYASATAPGYHLGLATVHRYVSSDVRVLRCVGAGFTVLLLATLGTWLGRRMAFSSALAAGLPVCASLYVITSGAWVLPDNLGWLTVLLALLLAYAGPGGWRQYVAAAALLAGAVFVRQVNLWPWGVLLVAAVIGDARGGADPGAGSSGPNVGRDRPPRVVAMLLAGVPALLILAWFYRMWGGLTPPAFHASGAAGAVPAGGPQHVGPNPAVPAMVLAVLGATGPFFAGFAWRELRAARATGRRPGRALAVGMIVGALAAVLVPTSWDDAAGRSSGLWNVARAFPVIADRSTLITTLAAAGGAVVAAGCAVLGPRDRWIWLSAWACFIAAQTANAMAWQRYYEPFCLLMLSLAAGRIEGRPDLPTPAAEPPTTRWRAAGPVLLAALLGAVTVWSMRPVTTPADAPPARDARSPGSDVR